MAQFISRKATLLLPATFTSTGKTQFFLVPSLRLSQQNVSQKGSLRLQCFSSLSFIALRTTMNPTAAARNTKAWLHYDRGIFLWGGIGKQWGNVYWLLSKTFRTYTTQKLCVCMSPVQRIVCFNLMCFKNVIWRDRSAMFKSKNRHMTGPVRNVLITYSKETERYVMRSKKKVVWVWGTPFLFWSPLP
jgi:hypothetical protein